MVHTRLRDSDTLFGELLAQRRLLVDRNICYEPLYRTRQTDMHDGEDALIKQYILSTAKPGASRRLPLSVARSSRKAASVYVGCSRHSIASRLRAHNGEGGEQVRKGTLRRSNRISHRWGLCMIIFLPENLTSQISTKVMRDYLRAAHKIEGKVRRCLQITRLFSLRYWTSPGDAEYVESVKKEVYGVPLGLEECSF